MRRHWLAEMERDLGAMVRDYRGDAQAARRLLEALLVAEAEGVVGLARIPARTSPPGFVDVGGERCQSRPPASVGAAATRRR